MSGELGVSDVAGVSACRRTELQSGDTPEIIYVQQNQQQ